MIKMQGIKKFYTNKFIKTWVLKDITLDIQKGEFVTIMGPSGAGKSTLLHIMGMLDNASGGEYYFNEHTVHKMKERQRTSLHQQNIGFIFQAYHLIDELNVYENLDTPLVYKKVKSSERKKLIDQMLERFKLTDKQKLFPNQLSGGQQQLVGVARALIINPKIILADEPTGNLNSQQGSEIMEILKTLNQEGTTIIQVTHDKEKAAYASRIIHLLDGLIEKEEQVPGKE